MPRNPYDVLGLTRDASPEEVKKAYRTLSKEWHPDKHKGGKRSEERFKEINEAYEILGNPEKKRMYDAYGERGGASPFGGVDFGDFAKGFGDFGSVFESFFGGGARRTGEAGRGGDHEAVTEIDLADALTDIERRVSLRRWKSCRLCGGSGSGASGKLVRCGTCGGTGQITRATQSFFGILEQRSLCPLCRGSGKVPESPCTQCKGEGREEGRDDVSVRIPAGIADGQSLRIHGEGDVGRQGAQPGDLYVRVRVRPDPRFTREENDTHSIIPLALHVAILGGEIPIATLHGDVTLRIPEGTQPGQVFRLRGKGLPQLGGSRMGDHYAEVQVEIPRKLSREERRLVEEWQKII